VPFFDVLNPPALGKPSGWNNGLLAPAGSRVLFIAGQSARNENGAIVSDSFLEQFRQCLINVLHVVRAAGGTPEQIGRMMVYVTDRDEYLESLRPLGEVWRAEMGRHYPAMALVIVKDLVDEGSKVEIEATAAIPSDDGTG
jgi:enamine deaminase RidA (YjgF/YER057c/UK114 family)